jgi:hypothetical protein
MMCVSRSLLFLLIATSIPCSLPCSSHSIAAHDKMGAEGAGSVIKSVPGGSEAALLHRHRKKRVTLAVMSEPDTASTVRQGQGEDHHGQELQQHRQHEKHHDRGHGEENVRAKKPRGRRTGYRDIANWERLFSDLLLLKLRVGMTTPRMPTLAFLSTNP